MFRQLGVSRTASCFPPADIAAEKITEHCGSKPPIIELHHRASHRIQWIHNLVPEIHLFAYSKSVSADWTPTAHVRGIKAQRHVGRMLLELVVVQSLRCRSHSWRCKRPRTILAHRWPTECTRGCRGWAQILPLGRGSARRHSAGNTALHKPLPRPDPSHPIPIFLLLR